MIRFFFSSFVFFIVLVMGSSSAMATPFSKITSVRQCSCESNHAELLKLKGEKIKLEKRLSALEEKFNAAFTVTGHNTPNPLDLEIQVNGDLNVGAHDISAYSISTNYASAWSMSTSNITVEFSSHLKGGVLVGNEPTVQLNAEDVGWIKGVSPYANVFYDNDGESWLEVSTSQGVKAWDLHAEHQLWGMSLYVGGNATFNSLNSLNPISSPNSLTEDQRAWVQNGNEVMPIYYSEWAEAWIVHMDEADLYVDRVFAESVDGDHIAGTTLWERNPITGDMESISSALAYVRDSLGWLLGQQGYTDPLVEEEGAFLLLEDWLHTTAFLPAPE